MDYKEAEKLLKQGEYIALPEWLGFWFNDMTTEETLVLTKDGEIVNTTWEEFKSSEDWIIVKPNINQQELIDEYFKSKVVGYAVTSQEIGNFGFALEALKEGKLVSREGWNGKGMFIVKQIPAVIGTEIIPKMQSLPQSAKDVLLKRNLFISYENQMLIVNANGRADSWVPSSSDCFAEDWIVL